jgi:hypothetical protein
MAMLEGGIGESRGSLTDKEERREKKERSCGSQEN